MSTMSLCGSQFAASRSYVAPSRIGIPRPSSAYPLPAPGSFGRGERFCGRVSASYDQGRPPAARGRKRVDRWTRDMKKKTDGGEGGAGNEAPAPPAPRRSPPPPNNKSVAGRGGNGAPAPPGPTLPTYTPPAYTPPVYTPSAYTSVAGVVGNGAPAQKRSRPPPAPKPTSRPLPFVPVEPGKWEAFAARVSGEWDGYSAEFNMFAEPQELPEEAVPREFWEWNRKVHDWQTQCPTIAHPEHGRFWYKVMRLHPTVGCEADAATVYSTDERDAAGDATALAYHASGSYTSVWPKKHFTNKKMVRAEDEVEVEQCLVHEKTRIRVFQKLGARRHILICREAWEGPFRNGESLGGCASAIGPFSNLDKLDSKGLLGEWNSEIYTPISLQPEPQGCTSREMIQTGYEVVEKTWSSTFPYGMFPKDTWTVVLKTESGGATIETGWLPEPDTMLVTKCEIGISGDLKDVSLRIEKRVSTEVAAVNVSAEDLEDLLTE